RFAAVGVGGLLLTSDDGQTWGSVFTPTEADLYRIERFDDGTWILGADGTVLSSPDLLFWDPVA
ncbi:MAG: cell wall-binding protein, partial [Actinobacteria bacterium]|nr:cell wall-binding protein [Actinomycetota bacterium]NIU65563.1 cell wall-binding protein [Actinomycetota bacterium]NIV87028.1 cell wall-binding protein [Actinomycetota bacterium]NIW27380.1 cell wall-binding protein [Actinomycetota bacterium]NIX19907.1 cell wall-binding protein [Actinomycetota bacterium]